MTNRKAVRVEETAAPARLPAWLRVPFVGARARGGVRRLLRSLQLHTVCEEARCPNLLECWRRHAAALMLLGDVCTRDCRFCGVTCGQPAAPDPAEPQRVARAAAAMGLRHVVLTSVTRDDLPDGGAAHFAAAVRALQDRIPGVEVEVLPPDFGGRGRDVATVMAAAPAVFNHNVETCARLSPQVRPRAGYRRSLTVLATAAHLSGAEGPCIKSGFMLGMGETEDEIHQLLQDLREHGVEIVTIGQYLPPSAAHWPLDRYVTPDEFAGWAATARRQYGYAAVVSGPLVRSSYQAGEALCDARLQHDRPGADRLRPAAAEGGTANVADGRVFP